VRGLLYDLVHYPGVVEGEGTVRGVVVRVPHDAWDCDGCVRGMSDPGGGDGLFRRIMTRATLEDGRQSDCWLYVYARDVQGRRVVPSGDWRRRQAEG
jgi:gamma-glutamylcyclotransferase (GGCT)/AIG2-like uncharacterized protein YtfP